MALAADFVRICLLQRGDRYVYGAEASLTDPDPDVFDCSELVQWACARVGVVFPDGSQNQEAACRAAGLIVPVAQGVRTQGALLFRHRPDAAHVAVSLGNGTTIEARGSAYGVGSWDAVKGRDWTAAGRIPGLVYGVPAGAMGRDTTGPGSSAPAWPGRYLMKGPPPMRGADVKSWQTKMKTRGWKIPVTGVYNARTADVCEQFQREKGLFVDGVVGEDTWNAAWLAPVV
jgi:cell wall-associated NlpC family hydrolase